MGVKDSYIRHEFVVSPEKHPMVAAWIEDPRNSGKVGSVIVALLESYLWAAKNVSGNHKSMNELIEELKSLSSRTNRLLAIVEGGTQERKGKPSGRERDKAALDSL